MINQKRLTEEFLELTSIPSLSRQEAKVARRLESILKNMGASVEVDAAGERVGGDTGNLLARFAGNTPGAPPFLLSGHMDTVGPAAHVRTIVEGDIIHTDHTSVLGGDDKAGLVAILEAIRVLRERSLPHGDLEVVITICEESGLLGAKHFDTARLRARRGLVLDVDGVERARHARARRQPARLHGARARGPRWYLSRAGHQRRAGSQRGDRGNAARTGRRRDHREPRRDSRGPRHQHRAEPGRGAGRDPQPIRGEAGRPDRAHARPLRGGGGPPRGDSRGA